LEKQAIELDLNHLNNNNTVKNKNTEHNISKKEYENSLNELKNEFQKNIKDLIPKNAKEIIAIRKNKLTEDTLTITNYKIILSRKNKQDKYDYNFRLKTLKINNKITPENDFLSFFETITTFVKDISEKKTTLKVL
tara:strand:- start:8717 stop:9124 length:408 start_codon:yes stop_codon:yes gene_type:complete